MPAHRVLIDADACPRTALEIARTLCEEKGWVCMTFASFNHLLAGEHHVVVDAEPQAVDVKLANEASEHDIVVTQDIGLAAMVVGKRAKALSPIGTIYRPERIGFQLEERNVKARYRRGGGRTRGPAARTKEDDQRFADALRTLMEKGESV